MSNKGSKKPNYTATFLPTSRSQESPHMLTPKIWWSSQKGKVKEENKHKEKG